VDDTLFPDGILQRPGDVLLAAHISEALGPVPPVEGLIGLVDRDGGRRYRRAPTASVLGVLTGLGGVGHGVPA
jgi:hypothetical protein